MQKKLYFHHIDLYFFILFDIVYVGIIIYITSTNSVSSSRHDNPQKWNSKLGKLIDKYILKISSISSKGRTEGHETEALWINIKFA